MSAPATKGSRRERSASSWRLQAFGEVETELVTLSDYRIGTCRGCRLCFEKGEENCPMKDDRDVLIGKIMASDGVVFASPELLVPGFRHDEDLPGQARLCFHRPRFFGTTFTRIVTQGLFGGKKIVKYLDSPPIAWASTPSRAPASRPWTRDDKEKERGTESLRPRAGSSTRECPLRPSGAVAPEALGLSDGPHERPARAHRDGLRLPILHRQGLVRVGLLLSRAPEPSEEGHRPGY